MSHEPLDASEYRRRAKSEARFNQEMSRIHRGRLKSFLFQRLLCLFSLYVFVSVMVYAFRHPEKTETQRFLEIGRALLWK